MRIASIRFVADEGKDDVDVDGVDSSAWTRWETMAG